MEENFVTRFSSPRQWITAGAFVSFSAALYQISFIRIISYVFPFQMMFTVSLVTGAAILFSGIGALLALRVRRFFSAAVVTAIAGPAALGGVSLFTTRSMTDFASFGTALALCAVPFTLYGLLSALCYRAVHDADRVGIARLVAFAAAAFFIGITGAAWLLSLIGVVTLSLLAAAALLLTAAPFPSAAIVWVTIALFLTATSAEEYLFPLIARKPALWGNFGSEPRVVGGGWSPYARVDLVDIGKGRLAGLYNGVQYWMTGSPEHDVPFRRFLYGAVTGSVLVIGTGGGHGLLSLTQASRIEAVELDPTVVSLLKGHLSSYNRNIYNTIAVAHAGDGRSYLDRSAGGYDAIILEAAEVGLSNYHRSFIALENYLYTREAMATAFEKLTSDGILIVIHTDRHVPRERFIKAFPPAAHFRTFQATSAIPGVPGMTFATDITIASRNEGTIERWASIVRSAAPDIRDQTEEVLTSDRFVQATAITDNRPVLYLERYDQLLPFALAALLLFLIAALLAWYGNRRFGSFFFTIGASFMLSELYILNMLRSALNGYVETSAVALGFYTLGMAGGALCATRITPRMTIVALIPSFLCLFGILTFFPFGAPAAAKIFLILLAVTPFAFFTGTLFPRGLFLAETKSVPRYYAIDTIASAGAFLLFYLITAVAGFPYAGIMVFAGYLGTTSLLLRAGH